MSETKTQDKLLAGSAIGAVTQPVQIPSGQTLSRGTVLALKGFTVPTTGTADGGNTGNGTCTVVTGGKNVQEGSYTVECVRAVTNGGEFRVTDPNGKYIGDILITAGAGGTGVFKSEEINLTVTDGSTDFALADKFVIAVADGVPATGTADGGNTGNGTMTAVSGGNLVKIGVYTMTCTAAATDGGTFSVVDPDGLTLPAATVGTAYKDPGDQINFLLNDSTTDFIVGDIFTVTVTSAARGAYPVDSTAGDGTAKPYGVLSEDVDASAALKDSIVYVSGEFNEDALIFGGTDTKETHRDAMRALGMYMKKNVAIPNGAV